MRVLIFTLFILLIGSCTTKLMQNNVTKTPPSGGWGAFDKQGHRGCRGLVPENTIPAMLHAFPS